jgi:hypothetical protein
VVDANGCEGVDTVEVMETTCVGIDDPVVNAEVSIYPNPTFGVFSISISTPGLEEVSVDLINTLGQRVLRVYDGQINGTLVKEIDAHDLAKGVYHVRMSFTNHVLTQKVVIVE